MKFLMVLAEGSGNQGVHCPLLNSKQIEVSLYKERNKTFLRVSLALSLQKVNALTIQGIHSRQLPQHHLLERTYH